MNCITNKLTIHQPQVLTNLDEIGFCFLAIFWGIFSCHKPGLEMGNLGEYLYLRPVITAELWHFSEDAARNEESFGNTFCFFGPSSPQSSGMVKRGEL